MSVNVSNATSVDGKPLPSIDRVVVINELVRAAVARKRPDIEAAVEKSIARSRIVMILRQLEMRVRTRTALAQHFKRRLRPLREFVYKILAP